MTCSCFPGLDFNNPEQQPLRASHIYSFWILLLFPARELVPGPLCFCCRRKHSQSRGPPSRLQAHSLPGRWALGSQTRQQEDVIWGNCEAASSDQIIISLFLPFWPQNKDFRLILSLPPPSSSLAPSLTPSPTQT